MFNLYSKLTTALAAFAIIFTTSAWSQVCVDIEVGGGSWDSEISWTLSDADGNIVADGIAGAYNVCLADGCYDINGFDSFGDGWNGAELSVSGPDGAEWITWSGPSESEGSLEGVLCVESPPPPPPPSCDGTEAVVSVGGGSWDSEISWSISDADGNELLSKVRDRLS